MDFNEYDEAEVNGTLLFLIRIMRAMGIAPVLIQKHLSIYYIRVSSLFTSKFVGPSIVAVLCTLVGVGLAWDIYIKDSEGALRVSTPSYTALCILDLGFTITVSCLGAFGALKRMQRVICYLNHIKKINIEISEDNKIKQKYTIIKNILVVFNLTVLFCGSLIIMLLYSAVYPGYFIICTLAMLLFLIVRLVNSALHAVNCDLNDIITHLDQENFEFSRENESNDISNKISLKSINKVIDHLGVLEEVRPVSNLSMENEIKLHRLLSQYIRISDTVAMINESEGTLMLIILMSLTFYFVNSSYELVATIMLSAELVNNWKYFLICHFTWVTYTFFNIISIIEACYGTTSEMEQTRAIVGNLLCHATSNNDPLFKELENSFYQLYLFNLQYSPMGMLTMDRGLIIAIMGFAATYVLLLTDFGFKMRFTFG